MSDPAAQAVQARQRAITDQVLASFAGSTSRSRRTARSASCSPQPDGRRCEWASLEFQFVLAPDPPGN